MHWRHLLALCSNTSPNWHAFYRYWVVSIVGRLIRPSTSLKNCNCHNSLISVNFFSINHEYLPIISAIGIVPPYSVGSSDLSMDFAESNVVKNFMRCRIFSETIPRAKSAANFTDGCILTALISLCLIGNVFCKTNVQKFVTKFVINDFFMHGARTGIIMLRATHITTYCWGTK